MEIGSRVGIVACSNGQKKSDEGQIDRLIGLLNKMGLEVVVSECLYEKDTAFNGTVAERAQALMRFYRDDRINAIFDISGGDLANELLDYLDYSVIEKSGKSFWGYSDLTTIINAIYVKTGNQSYLYQIKNLVWEREGKQIEAFKKSMFDGEDALFDIHWDFIQGDKMDGIVVGGNIRCLLKLAGTPYMPDFKGKILFLESLGGNAALMNAHLYQLKQMGVFNQIKGLLLGTFTKMEESKEEPNIIELVKKVIDNPNMAIVKTQEVGHANTSKCLIIGKEYRISKEKH